VALLEHEERLAQVHRRVEDLTPFYGSVEVIPLDRLYLFPRERLEDVHQCEEPDLFLTEWRCSVSALV
jgi:hypothetical protein